MNEYSQSIDILHSKKSFWRRNNTSHEKPILALGEKLKSIGSKLLSKSDSSTSTIHESTTSFDFRSDETPFSSLTLDILVGKPLKINVRRLPLLHKAIFTGNLGKLRHALSQNVNVDEYDDIHGYSPLHLTAELELPMFAKELLVGLEKNELRSTFANPNVVDLQYGRTPLMIAVLHQHFILIEILLEYGAYINTQDNIGCTCLHYAILTENIQLIEFLIQNKAHVDVIDKTGLSLLMHAIERGLEQVAIVLITSGMDIHVLDYSNKNALHYACSKDMKTPISLLVEKCIDKNQIDILNKKPLDYLNFKTFDQDIFDLLNNCSQVKSDSSTELSDVISFTESVPEPIPKDTLNLDQVLLRDLTKDYEVSSISFSSDKSSDIVLDVLSSSDDVELSDKETNDTPSFYTALDKSMDVPSPDVFHDQEPDPPLLVSLEHEQGELESWQQIKEEQIQSKAHNELKLQLETLEKRITRECKSREELQIKNKTLKEKAIQLESYLKTMDLERNQEILKLESKLMDKRELDNHIKRLEKKVMEMNQETELKDAKIKQLETILNKQELELTELSAAITDTENLSLGLAQKRQESKEWKSKFEELQVHVSCLTRDLEKKSNEFTSQREEYNQLLQHCKEEDHTKDIMNAQMESLKNEFKKLEVIKEKECAYLENQVKNYKSQTLDLQRKNQEQGFELDDTNKRLVELLDKLQVSESMYQDKLNHLKVSYNQVMETVTIFELERQKYMNTETELKECIQEKETLSESWKEKCLSTQDQNYDLQIQIQELQQELKDTNDVLLGLKIVNASLKKEVEVRETLKSEILDEISHKWDVAPSSPSRGMTPLPLSVVDPINVVDNSQPTSVPISANSVHNLNCKSLNYIDVGLLSPKVALIYLRRQ